ncbi:hypothetical protein HZH66_000622 [Vespula vulgaris]|uniref:Uncharacterized protein n=1 Tax=Vespula vulgaris TaxID=7454 RepID=A0A834KRH6_VESVU|nr:hypothetical protein HZH66_000622 [Vespula vulgaris]
MALVNVLKGENARRRWLWVVKIFRRLPFVYARKPRRTFYAQKAAAVEEEEEEEEEVVKEVKEEVKERSAAGIELWMVPLRPDFYMLLYAIVVSSILVELVLLANPKHRREFLV